MEREITVGEKYGRAIEIFDQEKAKEYFEECVKHTMDFGVSRERATEIELANIMYYAGYYGESTQKRIQNLYAPTDEKTATTETIKPDHVSRKYME